MKIVHTADIHFDTPFSGLTEAEKVSEMRLNLRTSFSKITDMAKDADMLFIAGDLFDGKMVTRTTLEFLKREFLKISHVKVFISAGNHDYLSENSCYKTFDFGENVYVFGTEPERIETENADIYGVSFKAPNDERALLPMFEVKNPDKINILVMHGNLAGEGYNPIKPVELENCGMDYVALGHIHLYSGVKTKGGCTYAYSGCPEGRGFDETGEKGALSLNIEKGHISYEFVPTCEKKYLILPIDVDGAESNDEIAEKMRNAICGEENIYRFILTGQSSFPIDTNSLKASINVFDCEVLDKTTPLVNLKSLSEEFTLKGLFAKYALEDKDKMTEEEFELALKVGYSLIEKEERNENR